MRLGVLGDLPDLLNGWRQCDADGAEHRGAAPAGLGAQAKTLVLVGNVNLLECLQIRNHRGPFGHLSNGLEAVEQCLA